MNSAKNVNDLSNEEVGLLVWREGFGPDPLTIVVSKASWDTNKKIIEEAGSVFDPNHVYVFESPVSAQGRKTTFHLQKVMGWCANSYSGIVPARG